MLLEHLLRRLDSPLLLGNINEVAGFNHGWRHLSWIPNNEIVDIVVVYDVGDGTRCLLHRLLGVGETTVLLDVRDGGLLLFVAFSLHEVVRLFLLVLG